MCADSYQKFVRIANKRCLVGLQRFQLRNNEIDHVASQSNVMNYQRKLFEYWAIGVSRGTLGVLGPLIVC